jgi:tetratricopeptide (TPR) repeat protein
MAKLFLSYAREDAAIAERLARALERGDEHDVWWDRDLHGGASFGAEIEQQLKDCDAVIVLWSPAGIQSPWVRDEAAIGRDAKKLIPVSMGAAEPPIGFRQFHTIDIGPHGRASGTAIEKLRQSVERVAGPGAQPPAAQPPKQRPANFSRRKLALGGVAAALIAAAGAGVYFWLSQPTALTVAVVPAAGQGGGAADYSRAIATDMASFLSAHGNAASVLDPADPDAARATYRFSVGYSGQGPRADTSLSMGTQGEQGIVWSRSWSVPDVSAVDLKKQMSFAASRALLCALEATGDPTRPDPSVLKLFIVACSGLRGAEIYHVELERDFSQIVQQAPRFAPAWQYLAFIRAIVVTDRELNQGSVPQPLRDAALDAISHVRQLSPKSGFIPAAEGVLSSLSNWQRQLRMFDRAIALEPNEPLFYSYRSISLAHVGRMHDSLADAEKATQLDPLSAEAAGNQIFALIYAGSKDEAKDQLAADYKVWPNNKAIVQADFAYSFRYGDPQHAQQLLSKVVDEDSPVTDPSRKLLIARQDPTSANIEDAINAWRHAVQSNENLMAAYLLALGTFGKTDEAFEVVSDPNAPRFTDPQAFFRPELAAIRQDPRFMAVAAQYGLVRYWSSTGNWPDFCSDPRLPYNCKTEAAKYK